MNPSLQRWLQELEDLDRCLVMEVPHDELLFRIRALKREVEAEARRQENDRGKLRDIPDPIQSSRSKS